MCEADDLRKLAAEVAEIDLQMAALAERKRKSLVQLSIAESPENQMSREERREALAEALAEGIVYLGERGLLPLTKDPILGRPTQVIKSKSPNRKPKKRGL